MNDLLTTLLTAYPRPVSLIRLIRGASSDDIRTLFIARDKRLVRVYRSCWLRLTSGGLNAAVAALHHIH